MKQHRIVPLDDGSNLPPGIIDPGDDEIINDEEE